MNPNWLALWTETEISYLGKLISDIFQAIDRGHNPRNGIRNDHIGVVLLLVHSSTYSKVEDYETENKTHADIEYRIKKQWGQPPISTSSRYQVLQPRTGLANYHLLQSLFIFKKMSYTPLFTQSKLFVNGFHFNGFH